MTQEFFLEGFSKKINSSAFDFGHLKKVSENLEFVLKILDKIKYPEIPDFLPMVVNENYFFGIITNHKLLIEAFRLRFLAYSDEEVRYINKENFPLGIEFDKFDQVSIHFYAVNIQSGKLCGYIRLIEDSKLGLQLEKNINVSDYRENFRICEGSRMIAYPRGQPIVARTLNYLIKKIAKENGNQKILGESRISQKAFFERIGQQPMEPFRSWKLFQKKEWGIERDDVIYGHIGNLDQDPLK